jgi:hypothetical protein
MHSAQPLGTLGSVASMLAATLYQGHHDKHRKLEYLISGDIYIYHLQVLLEYYYI